MSRSELALAALALLSGLSFAAVTPTLPLYVERLGASYQALGLFFSAYSLTWSVLQLYTGYLSDRYGRRRLARIGLAIYGLSALACAWAGNFSQLLAFRILQGIGLGLLGPALLGLVAGLKHPGRAFALYRTAQVAGEVIGPVAGGMVGMFGLGKPFLLSAGASGLALGATFLLGEEMAGGERETKTGFLAAARAMFSRRGFLLLGLGTFLAEMGYVARGVAVPLAGEAVGLSTGQIGLVMSAYSLVFILSQVPIGALVRAGRVEEWKSGRVDRKPLLVGCALLGALGFGGLSLATSAWQMGAAMSVLGLALGTIFVQSAAWAAELAPAERQSLYLASFDTLIDLSFPLTPLLVGPLFGLGVRLPFLLCTALLFLSAGVLWRVPDRPQ